MPINSFEDYPMSWKPDLTGVTPPLYKALATLLENDIRNGHLKPGDLLPPQRELADYLDLNLSTITKAFKLCSQRGLISASVGKGTYVSTDVHVNTTLLDPQKAVGLIEMGAIHPSYEQNHYVLQVIQQVLSCDFASSLLEYNAPYGTPSQKNAGVTWLKRHQIETSPEHILLSNGGQNALCAILSALFKPGDRIGTDPLTFSGFKTLAKMLGIQLVPIPLHNDEISPIILDQLCQTEGLKGIYLIPDYHNPTTHHMSLRTRKAIASVAKKHNLLIIEDGIYSLLKKDVDCPAFARLIPDQTIYIASLSKTLCAGLRLAFIMTPLSYKAALERALYNINLMVSPLSASIAEALIDSPLIDTILMEKQEAAYKRNQLTNTILKGYSLLGDVYSTFRWLLLPPVWSGKAFEACAKNAGVQIYCAERFAIGNATVPAAVRLATSAPKSLEELETGLLILRTLLESEEEFTLF